MAALLIEKKGMIFSVIIVVGGQDIEDHTTGQFAKLLTRNMQANGSSEQVPIIQRIGLFVQHATGRVKMDSLAGLDG